MQPATCVCCGEETTRYKIIGGEVYCLDCANGTQSIYGEPANLLEPE
jgi:hypothetical protein